jgi:hypothetical protein
MRHADPGGAAFVHVRFGSETDFDERTLCGRVDPVPRGLTDLRPLKRTLTLKGFLRDLQTERRKPPVAKVFVKNHPLNAAGVAALTS